MQLRAKQLYLTSPPHHARSQSLSSYFDRKRVAGCNGNYWLRQSAQNVTSANANLVFYRWSRRAVEILVESVRMQSWRRRRRRRQRSRSYSIVREHVVKQRIDLELSDNFHGETERFFFFCRPPGATQDRAPSSNAIAFARPSNRADNSRKIRFYNTFFAIKISIAVNRSSGSNVLARDTRERFRTFIVSRLLLYFLLVYISTSLN